MGSRPQGTGCHRDVDEGADLVIAKGILAESEVAHIRRAYEDPTFSYRLQLMQSVWGRKPLQR